jgi:capsid protein
MSQVNFSSARVGLGEEREIWRQLQSFLSQKLHRRVFHRWLYSSLLSGKLTLTQRDVDQVKNPNWRPRGWSYIEPQKDITAALAAIGGNLVTYKEHFAERGIDLEEFLAEKQAEKALFAQYGIEYGPPKQPAPGAAADETGDETDDEEATKKPQDDGERSYTNGKYAF